MYFTAGCISHHDLNNSRTDISDPSDSDQSDAIDTHPTSPTSVQSSSTLDDDLIQADLSEVENLDTPSSVSVD